MHLRILLPFDVLADVPDVLRVIAETSAGSFGLLPNRLDCVAALVPGILVYETAAGEVYVAVDEGALVKCGSEVLVSVRRAVVGTDLAQLQRRIDEEFLQLDAIELGLRSVMSRVEAGFMRRMATFDHA